MTEIKELTLLSRIESVDEAALKADEFVKELGLGEEFVSAVDLAIRESVANAVKHGNKFDESKPVKIKMINREDGLEITVRDFGAGFAVDTIPDPTDPANLLKVNGRGILFMRSFMDEVEWSQAEGGGMAVTMFKRALSA
ncbi:MAG: ATP-binding protein [Pyrinomonadaceae bacterium]